MIRINYTSIEFQEFEIAKLEFTICMMEQFLTHTRLDIDTIIFFKYLEEKKEIQN